MSQGEWRKHNNNNNHNHNNNNNTCSTSYTVGESTCVCVVSAAAATRSPAGRIIVVVVPPPPTRASWLLRRRRDAFFFKAAFSSGLETKERIGTECQRPTVLGRNFYLFFSYDPTFYLLILCECVHTDTIIIICIIICDIVAPHVTRVVSAGIYYQTGINKLLLINHKVILMTSYTKYRWFENYSCSTYYYYYYDMMRIKYFSTLPRGSSIRIIIIQVVARNMHTIM